MISLNRSASNEQEPAADEVRDSRFRMDSSGNRASVDASFPRGLCPVRQWSLVGLFTIPAEPLFPT